jgi:GINS complex subunit 3
MNKPSYFPNYYSIEDVLVTQEKVPCDPAMVLSRMGELKNCFR